MVTRDDVLRALSEVQDPELKRSLTELNMVEDVEIDGGTVRVTIALDDPRLSAARSHRRRRPG